HADLSSRLFAQALQLKDRSPDDESPIHVIDLTTEKASETEPTGDQLAKLLQSMNDLADAHLKDNTTPHPSNQHSAQAAARDTHWQAKQLFKRARQLGLASSDQQVLEQLMRADLGLARLYVVEQLSDDAFKYLKEAYGIEAKITGKPTTSN